MEKVAHGSRGLVHEPEAFEGEITDWRLECRRSGGGGKEGVSNGTDGAGDSKDVKVDIGQLGAFEDEAGAEEMGWSALEGESV